MGQLILTHHVPQSNSSNVVCNVCRVIGQFEKFVFGFILVLQAKVHACRQAGNMHYHIHGTDWNCSHGCG